MYLRKAMYLRVASLGTLFVLCAAFTASHAEAARKAKPAQSEPAPQDTTLDNVKDAPKAPVLACDGPFAKDTTHAKLEAAFGAKNVAFKDVEVTNNVLTKATVLFDDDPTKRVVVYWKDNKTRTKPSSFVIEAPSTWRGPGGVRNGLTLKELQKINGDFKMMGFGGIGGGEISGLSGPFVNLAGDCVLKITLEPGIANPLPPRFASVTGDIFIASKNLVLRRVRPQVSKWVINY